MEKLNCKIIQPLFFFLCLPLSLLAQVEKPIEKGNALLGGRFGGYYSTGEEEVVSLNYKHYNLSCLPDVGYFFIDNLALGLTFPLNIYWTKQLPIISNYEIGKSYSVGLGPFLKYYSNNGIITVLSITYNHYYYKYHQANPHRYSGFQISPGAGYAIFINQKVSLEMTVSYQYNYTSDTMDKEHSVHLNAGFQIFL